MQQTQWTRTGLAGGAFLLAIIVTLSLRQKFDADEFEGLHSAWKLLQGERIYVDFFQHHHPLLYYLLVPVHALLGETTRVVFAARLLMLPFVLGTMWLTFRLARQVYGPGIALLAALLLPILSTSFTTGIESRPDVPQVFFGLLSVWLLYRYFDDRRVATLALAGLAFGISFLFLQKALLLGIALAGVLAVRAWQRTFTLRDVVILAAAAAAAPAAYVGYLALHGELAAYAWFNFTFNAGRGHSARQLQFLVERLTTFSPIVLLCFVYALVKVRKTAEQREMAVVALMLGALVLAGGVHFRQYYLMLLPFMAMVAAQGFASLLANHRRVAALALALIAAPALHAYGTLIARGNSEQIRKIEYVLKKAPPGSYVYDGNVQFNLFRRDLDFFWFAVLPGRELDRYRRTRAYPYDVTDLIDRLEPAVISTAGIPDLYDRRIFDHYRTTPYPDLLVRRPDR